MATTIIGTRLQDETGVDFLVVSIPWESVATRQAAEDTLWHSFISNSLLFWRLAALMVSGITLAMPR
jgi:hypothetical protein